jgi:hypothetical protein
VALDPDPVVPGPIVSAVVGLHPLTVGNDLVRAPHHMW